LAQSFPEIVGVAREPRARVATQAFDSGRVLPVLFSIELPLILIPDPKEVKAGVRQEEEP
jgi:hypothetical protein